MNILLIDNYDSFTYNLRDLIYKVSGHSPQVVRNDALSMEEVRRMPIHAFVVSPGPGDPRNPRYFGLSATVIAQAEQPILGVCLGHQGIACAFGGEVGHAPEPVHGLTERIAHCGAGLFQGIPQGMEVVRYHSLAVAQPLPQALKLTAWTESGIVMGIEHHEKPIHGVQFHPESICSSFGDLLIHNFLKEVAYGV